MSDLVSPYENLSELLEVAATTAVAAAALTREKFLQAYQLQSKGFRDLVTEVDVAAQKIITDSILARFPDHGFLTEEEDSSLPASGPVRWVIDPIDGTTNYSRRVPEFSISIAAVNEQQELLVGVIYDPVRDELFRAAKGQGAWLNEQRLVVSGVASLASSLLFFDWSREVGKRETILRVLERLAPQVFTGRSIGTAALAMAWLAAGRLDAYFNISLSAWDVAAAALLIAEAGGLVTDGEGRPFDWQDASKGVLATNGRVHQAVLAHVGSIEEQ